MTHEQQIKAKAEALVKELDELHETHGHVHESSPIFLDAKFLLKLYNNSPFLEIVSKLGFEI